MWLTIGLGIVALLVLADLFLPIMQQNILNLLTPIFRGFPYLKCGYF